MNKLKFLREEKGLLQSDIAKIIGTTPQAVGLYEKEKRDMSPETIIKLADYFSVTVDYLLGKSYYRNYEEFTKLDEFVSNYMLSNKSSEITTLIANTLNYINTHKNEDANEIINNAIKDLPTSNQNILRTIISHLHYRYHGKIPKNINTDNNINRITSQDINNINKVLKKYYMCPVYGQISAGQPNWAEECIEGRIPIDVNLMDIVNPEEHFFLRVNRWINE